MSNMSKTAKPRSKSKAGAKSPVKAKTTAFKTVATEVIAEPRSRSTLLPSILQRWNIWAGIIFLAQAAVILLLSDTRHLPVTANYVAKDPLAEAAGNTQFVPAMHHLFDLNVTYLVVLFLLVAGVIHLVAATKGRERYEHALSQRVNALRWMEYTITASIMLMVMVMLAGVFDATTLLLVLVLSIIMHVLGLLVELHSKGGKADWTTWRIACLAGSMPWAVFIMYAVGTGVYGMTHLPGYVYGIWASMLVIFFGFATNLYLQRTGRGRWGDYLYGEKVFIVLSLIAKTALAWQIFAGLLRP